MRVYMGLRNSSVAVNSIGRSATQLRSDFTRITREHVQMIRGLSKNVAANIRPSKNCVSVPQTLFAEALRQLSPESRAIPSGNTGIFSARPVTTLSGLNRLLAECLEKPGFLAKSWLVEHSGALNIYFQAINLHEVGDVVGVIVPLDVAVSDRITVK